MKEFFYNLMAQIYGIKIQENKKDVYYLKGICVRLYADSYKDDLVLCDDYTDDDNFRPSIDEYNDLRVKRVINDSTTTIMNNITKEIEHHNLQYNSHELLPWSKNYR